MPKQNNPLLHIKVCIHKLHESNGNVQIVAKAYRTDVPSTWGYQIAIEETKHLDLNECLKRVWLYTSMFVNFVGLTIKDVDVYWQRHHQYPKEIDDEINEGLKIFSRYFYALWD